MESAITFLGAARNVTGSRYLLECGNSHVLVDCGLHQERAYRARDWEPFAFPPDRIDAVILTHAHLDHCGYLPKLVADGFSGPIFCTPASADIAKIVLRDAAYIMAEDAKHKQRRHDREKRKSPRVIRPLYTEEDVTRVNPLFTPVSIDIDFDVADGVTGCFHEAGHILGSAMVRLVLGGNRSVLFSGDIGRWDKPILNDPDVFEAADFVVMESTYGDRRHEDPGDLLDLLADAVDTANTRGGNLIIPSFAIGRTQELLYQFNQLLVEDRIPHLSTFLDSPMAIRVTDVFRAHPELFDEQMNALVHDHQSPFAMPNLNYSKSSSESKAINHIRGTVVVIAGSGMCTGGRIKHHLVHNISRPESVVLFVGYQAYGTLGREISSGKKSVRIFGAHRDVRARVLQLHGFSAHADQDELLRWLGSVRKAPKRIFVTHGEDAVAEEFSDLVTEKTGIASLAPEYHERVVL
jgi:metallo-beta-lactamase family protein